MIYQLRMLDNIIKGWLQIRVITINVVISADHALTFILAVSVSIT